jgi:hypothetical protein
MAAPGGGAYPFQQSANASQIAPIQYPQQPVFYYANQQPMQQPQQAHMQQMQLQQPVYPAFQPTHAQMMGHAMGVPYSHPAAGPSAEQQKQQLAAAKAAKADAMFGDIVVGMGLSKAAPTPTITPAEPVPSMNIAQGVQFAPLHSGMMPLQHGPQGYGAQGMPVQYFMVQQPNGAMYMMPMQPAPVPAPSMPLTTGTMAAPTSMESVRALPVDVDSDFSDFTSSAPAPQYVAPPKIPLNNAASGAHMLDSMFGDGGSAALLPAAKPAVLPSSAANRLVARESAVRRD